MNSSKKRPYVIYMAEIIYLKISSIKKESPDISNIEAVDRFIGTKEYNEFSSGKFHDIWFKDLQKNNFVDNKSGEKIPEETIRLLKIQKNAMMQQLIQFPKLYYAKSSFPLEISQRAFNFIWRTCESYELWCRETQQSELIILKVID